jgi:hypothetical protein
MQIDRRPNRGPYLAALVCLLTLCLTIPLYWQSNARRAEDEPAGASDEFAGFAGGGLARVGRVPDPTVSFPDYAIAPYGDFRQYGIPQYGQVDTLDELLMQHVSRRAAGANVDADLLADLLAEPPRAPEASTSPELSVVGQYILLSLRQAGRGVVRLEPGDEIGSLVARLAEYQGSRPHPAAMIPTRSLVLVSPNDRVAMVPQRVAQRALPAPAADDDWIPSPWSEPTILIRRLEVLAQHPYSADWARQSLDDLRALTEVERPRTSDIAARLEHLQTLTAEALQLANATHDDRLRAELLRSHWGLARRLQCWSLMRDIVVASLAENRFAARVPWDATTNALSGQGTEPADLHSLSDDLEAYERTRTPRLARAIVERQRLLAQSNDDRQRELADQIEQNYRNANVRLALSAAMLERFVPQQQEELSPVHDRIVGTPVRGHSITTAQNKVKLEPDAGRWNMGLESDGTVDSQTVADGGQVKISSCGTTEFSARKSIIVDPNGVQLGSSTADTHNFSQLMGIRSSYDWIPVVSDMVRSRAIDEYHRKQPQAQAEVECKVARRVEQQLDDRADTAVEKMEGQFRDQVTGPLAAGGVEVTPIELSTTAQRVIARLRVAGKGQLAGHTPRPRAPADSLASVQVHESALSNAAIGVGLDGKRLTAKELQTLIREKFARSNGPAAMVVDEKTVFAFADRDAVRFRVADQRLELILSMREVIQDGESVRNFRVHVFFVPVIHGLEAEFVRDGALGIEGRIGTGERARMHNVFNKVFTEDRPLPIVRLEEANDPRLAGLMITQLVLEDGWIGLAVGPTYAERTAERTRMLR